MTKTGIWRTALLFLLFFAFTLAVLNVDVQPVSVEDITSSASSLTTEVGFASLNGPVHKALPYSNLFYKLSTLLGYLALFWVGAYGLLGVMQLIRRRSLKKVDAQLISLGIFFVLVLICYVLFEKLPINYRPVLMDAAEGLEASYPSSHTMLGLCVFGAMMVPYPELFPKKAFTLIRISALVFMVLSVVTRTLSGVHWLTDIVGGLLLSAALLSLYVSMLQIHALRNAQDDDDDDKDGVDDGFGDLFRNE